MNRVFELTVETASESGRTGHAHIRNATTMDLDAITNIETNSFSSPWPREAFLNEIDGQKWSRVVVLECDSEIVGFMVYWVVEDELHLSNIAIEKQWRRTGLGRHLVDYLIGDGKKNGQKLVFLEVRVSNQVAINLYKSYGFEDLDIRKKYYVDNGEDALIMYLRLESASQKGRIQ